MLCKSFLTSEQFEGPHVHCLLEKGFLHAKYALNRFLEDTTWRCTWKHTLGKCLTIQTLNKLWQTFHQNHSLEAFPQRREAKSVTTHKRKAHVNNVLRFHIWKNIVCQSFVSFEQRVTQCSQWEFQGRSSGWLWEHQASRALWLRCPYLEFTAQSSPSRAFPVVLFVPLSFLM